MIPVPKLENWDAVFGNVSFLPKMEDIPEQFKKHEGTKWNKIMNTWFFYGLPAETKFIAKPGVDEKKAKLALKAVLTSFSPSHEHKKAGVAYLMSEWFEDIQIPDMEGHIKKQIDEQFNKRR